MKTFVAHFRALFALQIVLSACAVACVSSFSGDATDSDNATATARVDGMATKYRWAPRRVTAVRASQSTVARSSSPRTGVAMPPLRWRPRRAPLVPTA